MLILRFAALVSALTTIILNAHAGYIAAATPDYAILFATLSAALDVAKCSLIPAGVAAVRQRAYLVAFLAFALFPLLFANSVWNAVSQVTQSRETTKADATTGIAAHIRTEAVYKRLSNELVLMQANPTFAATASCALPKSRTARAFCAKVEATSKDLSAAEAALRNPTPADPAPQLTLLAAVTGQPLPTLTLTLNVIPVLLAELVGSLGFVIAAATRTDTTEQQPAPKASGRLWSRFGLFRLPTSPATTKTPPAGSPGPSASHAKPGATPAFHWSLDPPR